MTNLTPSTQLTNLELSVEAGLKAGRQAWDALRKINNTGLYKERGYDSFAKYLSSEWQVDIKTARRNIAAAATRERLTLAVGSDPDLEKIQTERQLRPFVGVQSSEIKQVFDKAATLASDEGSSKITTRHIEKAKSAVVAPPRSPAVVPSPVATPSAPIGRALSPADATQCAKRALEGLAKFKKNAGQLGLIGKQHEPMLNLIEDRLEQI